MLPGAGGLVRAGEPEEGSSVRGGLHATDAAVRSALVLENLCAASLRQEVRASSPEVPGRAAAIAESVFLC